MVAAPLNIDGLFINANTTKVLRNFDFNDGRMRQCCGFFAPPSKGMDRYQSIPLNHGFKK
jgi:hypothetical protein